MLPNTMPCPYCGVENPAATMYCSGCGNILRGMAPAESQFISNERGVTTGQFAPGLTFMPSTSSQTFPSPAPLVAPPPPISSLTPPPYDTPMQAPPPPPEFTHFPGPVTGQPAKTSGAMPRRRMMIMLGVAGLVVAGGGGALALSRLSGPRKPHPNQGSNLSPVSANTTPTPAATATTQDAPSPTATPTQAPTPTPTPTPKPTPSLYPQLAASYNGTAHNITAKQSAAITLSSMNEDAQGNISGYLTIAPPLSGSGTITGTVSRSGAIKFVSHPTDGTVPINWYGTIQANGSISGTYTVPGYQQKGTWQASPA